jgi:hypothetical protein
MGSRVSPGCPMVDLDAWPPRHRIVVFPHQGGAAEVVGCLQASGVFDPVLLRVSVAGAAGEYVLLPDDQAERWDAAGLAIARRAADIELFPTAAHRDDGDDVETAAFTIRVDQVDVGRWASTAGGGSAVSWDGAGEACRVHIECDGESDPAAILTAIRSVIPPPLVAAVRAKLPALRIAVGVE